MARVVVWSIVVVLALFVIIGSRINLNQYALLPGTAQPVQPFITVPADQAHHVVDPVLLTDVAIGRVTVLNWLWYHLHSDAALLPLLDVTGGTDPAQLTDQGNLEMAQAEAEAKAAALRQLGYVVPATAAGAVVFGTFVGTPASGVLHVGDVITAVDGTVTRTARSLTATLQRYHSGQTVTFTVHAQGSATTHQVPITLHSTRVDLGGGQYVTLNLGVEPEDQVAYSFPVDVRINVTNIGGPSAGLAMTLGVIDTLTGGHLTGGHTVAATGTMDASGQVGDVGGVAQKTVAVERAGATIFLVPPQEYEAAKSKDIPSLKVYAVSTLHQALAILIAHGGTPASVAQASSSHSLG